MSKEILKIALEALEPLEFVGKRMDGGNPKIDEAITAIKEALAQPEQEPVAFINVEQRKLEWAKYMSWDTPTVVNLPNIPLYTTPPQRTWVGLTDEEAFQICVDCGCLSADWLTLLNAIEAKLKQKNEQQTQ